MSPEAQQLAIAEFHGFSEIRMSKHWELWDEEPRSRLVGVTPYCSVVEVPDYLGDLNAMHEPETRLLFLRPDLREAYVEALANIAGADDYFRATASERAEAFLRTVGRWKATP